MKGLEFEKQISGMDKIKRQIAEAFSEAVREICEMMPEEMPI